MQMLRSIGAIRIAKLESSSTASSLLVSEPDSSRREYFEPELSLRHLMSGVLRERVAPLAATGNERVDRLREFGEASTSDRAFYLARVKQLEVWRRRLKTVLPLLTKLLGPKGKG
jgi:hypothetical protein